MPISSSIRTLYGGPQIDRVLREDTQLEVEDAMKIASLIERFRHRGHLCANLDPLGRVQRGPWMSEQPNNRHRYVLSRKRAHSTAL